MITICGILETGWDLELEHLAWRQLKGAWLVNLVLVPRDFQTLEEVLDAYEDHKKVFLIPPGRMKSINFKDYIPPEGDIMYIFGKAQENLVRFVKDGDMVVSIHTPGTSDLFSISVVGIVLNECR